MQDEIIVHCPRKLLIKIFSFLFALHDFLSLYMQILTAGNGQKLQKLMFLFHEINLRMKVFPVCFSQNIAPGIVYQKYQALQDRDIFIFMFLPT